MKPHQVTVYTVVDIPYEDGLVKGKTNKNHIIFQAHAQLEKTKPRYASFGYEVKLSDGAKKRVV